MPVLHERGQIAGLTLLAFSFYLGQSFFYLLFCKGFPALGALINFIDEPVIDEIVGKVNTVKPKGKIVNELKVFIFTFVT